MRSEFVFILFCLVLAPYIAAETITGEVITGEVTSSDLGMTISVVGVPLLIISSPKNETYITTNILLNYLVNDEEAVWYSLDGGSNTTLVSSINFYAGEGSHSLFLYANNSYGTSSKSVTFNINSSKLIIFYEEYNGSGKGASTNFYEISYEDLQSLEGIVLERSDYGKIVFNNSINVTNDLINFDNIVNLDNNTDISFNSIYLNSTELPNFNQSATLFLYNLSFSNPRILVDGEVCPPALCNIVSYSGGTLEFTVSHFSGYSAEETPVYNNEEGGSGGGSGGGTLPAVTAGGMFNVSVKTIGSSVKIGGVITKEIIVTNLGDSNLDFNMETQGLENLISIRPSKFSLSSGESKTIFLDFIAREDQIPNLYIGKLMIEAGGKTQEILIFVDVESRQELFDVEIEIPEDYLEVFAGGELIAEIELSNMGDADRIDVEIEYFIRNEDGEDVSYYHDTRAVVTKLGFVKNFDLPKDLKPGKYVLYVKVNYAGNVASASSWFSVAEKSTPMKMQISRGALILIWVLVIAIGLAVIFFLKTKYKKSRK